MIICADDFGLHSEVNAAILHLLEENRLSAVSVMVRSSSDKEAFRRLSHFRERADIGLHFDLSDIPFSKLAFLSYTGKLESKILFQKLTEQYKSFIDLLGFPPCYIDGHQHVHQLPIVRDALMRFIREVYRPDYVRVAGVPASWPLKHLSFLPGLNNYILAYPAHTLEELLLKNGIAHNRYLLGYCGINTTFKFSDIFDFYLSVNSSARDIFHCHPSLAGSLEPHRSDVYKFILSPRFEELKAKGMFSLNRF